jgi:hypothetical protein
MDAGHATCNEIRGMKTKYLRVLALSVVTGGGVLMSGCVVRPDGRLAFQPVVVEAPPPVTVEATPAPPPPVVTVDVPDDYVWDGYEYVGLVGGTYFYLGPGNVWLVCDPFRLDRFHGWERGHPDWRYHTIRNDHFRRDAHGNERPRHDDRH